MHTLHHWLRHCLNINSNVFVCIRSYIARRENGLTIDTTANLSKSTINRCLAVENTISPLLLVGIKIRLDHDFRNELIIRFNVLNGPPKPFYKNRGNIPWSARTIFQHEHHSSVLKMETTITQQPTGGTSIRKAH